MKDERKKIRKFGGIFLSAFLLFALAPCVYATDTLITPSTNGSYTLANGGSYVINGNYSVSNYSITLSSGSATLTVNGNVTINDSSNGKSPIAVNGGTLTLVVNGTLTVYGGNAQASVAWNGSMETLAGGSQQNRAGGYAGIYIPVSSRLVVTGGGTINAYGGNANFGGAGAGIGGNGGYGYHPSDQCGVADGGVGGAAGTIVLQSARIVAYGGSGGAGQTVRSYPSSNPQWSSTSGSGYPAAGIGGGGGAGGSWGGWWPWVYFTAGGGGFNGGSGGGCPTSAAGGDGVVYGVGGTPGNNGGAGIKDSATPYYSAAGGGGYFGKAADIANSRATSYGGTLGGGYATTGAHDGHPGRSGQGGGGGAGGTVTIAEEAQVTAYNGNYNSASPASASYQTPIYAQLGYTAGNIRAKTNAISDRTASAVASRLNGLGVTKSVSTTTYGAGIGAGAGFTEGNNGTVTDEATKPGTPQVAPIASGTLGVYGWSAPTGYHTNASITGYRVDVYSDAACSARVKTLYTANAGIPTASSPLTVDGLTNGQAYYIKVSALFGYVAGLSSNAPGIASEAASGMPYGVDITPAAGSYYKKVEVTLTGAGVAESGGTLVYSLDGGAKWEVYPLTGLTLTQSAELEYGVREASGEVQKMGSRTYNVCSLPFEFASLTLHNSANGTGADIGGQSAAGLTGSVSAKVSGLKSYTSNAGYIVLAVYSANGAMERMTLTPIGGQSGEVVSKAIALPRALTAGDTVRAFVVAGFVDVAPIGKVVEMRAV